MKEKSPLFNEATALLKRAQLLDKEARIGVNEGVYKPDLLYPTLPLAMVLMTDAHYGSIHTNYDLLESHLNIIKDTPNFSLVTNGDDVDSFIAMGKVATGTYENPLPPQLQTQAYMEKLRELDAQKKIGAMSFGNHNNFMFIAGFEWLESYARGMNANIFTAGGKLDIDIGKEKYELAMTHKFWGTSKLNPGNAPRRFLQWEYPDADIVFLGHTHQSNMETFEIAGKERIGVIGGTYKSSDNYAKWQGIGRRSGQPGMTVMLWPNEHKMLGFKHIEDAQQYMLSMVFAQEQRKEEK